jgi:hypothetical protein
MRCVDLNPFGLIFGFGERKARHSTGQKKELRKQQREWKDR